MAKINDDKRRLALRLSAAGMNYTAIADRVGVHVNTVRYWCNPKARDAQRKHARRWAQSNPERVRQASLRWRGQHADRVAAYYRDNREQYKQRAAKWQSEHPEQFKESRKKAIQRDKEFVEKYLSTHPCEFCGESDPVVLCFHHRDPKTKSDTISNLIAKGASLKKLKSEISKCQVLCHNCHVRLHYNLRNGAH